VTENCDFCAIARGDAAAEVVCEGEHWIAFFPLSPATPGHTLVIPRTHVKNLWEASPSRAGTLMEAVIEVGRAIQDSLQPDGLNLITSAGSAAEQTVPHLHLHLVPRWADDDFGHIWPPATDMPEDIKRDAATRIRAACRRASK
jgi:histidine triad (HIT) family protein